VRIRLQCDRAWLAKVREDEDEGAGADADEGLFLATSKIKDRGIMTGGGGKLSEAPAFGSPEEGRDMPGGRSV
jgi:hypothetical protein